ncbi:MAG: DUF4367 domain-containing protein [Anaerovoracaceae bacterium]
MNNKNNKDKSKSASNTIALHIQEAVQKEVDKQPAPKLDLSFIDDEVSRNVHEGSYQVANNTKSRPHFFNFPKLAFVAACIIALSVGISVWVNVESAYGGKAIVAKIVPFFGNNNSDDLSEIEFYTTSERKVGDAKDFFPGYYFLKDIPKAYIFKEIKIKKTGVDFFASETRFTLNGENDFLVVSQFNVPEEGTTFSEALPVKTDKTHRELYFIKDPNSNINSILFAEKDYVFSISAKLPKSELVEIAAGLLPYSAN